MKSFILNFLRSQEGATAIEYALIASFIAMVCITALGTVGTNLSNKFSSVALNLT